MFNVLYFSFLSQMTHQQTAFNSISYIPVGEKSCAFNFDDTLTFAISGQNKALHKFHFIIQTNTFSKNCVFVGVLFKHIHSVFAKHKYTLRWCPLSSLQENADAAVFSSPSLTPPPSIA